MALCHRIRSNRIDRLAHQFRILHSLFAGAAGPSAADLADGRRRFASWEEPLVRAGMGFRFSPVRCFAAPIQAKAKPEDKGPRLNEAITAVYVRLVTDQGHNIVSRMEALQQAVRLNLDLVEVQRTADPPVCKIMDFHKEKFNKEVKEKERAKNKVALRNGENKEVRFKAKTELKDLKIKAKTIERLMERGYRVKCTSLPTGKEEEDLVGLLSSLIDLIKDVAVVETGPHVVDTRQAYVIVRHIKFMSKKAGKKASDVLDAVRNAVPRTQADEEWEPVKCSSETEDEFRSDQVNAKAKLEAKKEEMHTKASPGFVSSQSEPSTVESNRYSKQSEKKAVFSHGKMADRRVSNESRGRVQSDPKQRQFNINNHSPPARHGAFSAPKNGGSSNQNKPGVTVCKPSEPSSPSKSFGIFSALKTTAAADPSSSLSPRYGVFSTSRDNSPSGQGSGGDATVVQPRNPSSPSPRYGIFSATKPVDSDQKNSRDATVGNSSCSPTASYGIFSSSKTTPPADQRNVGDATVVKQKNPSSPTPSFGIFSAKKPSPSNEKGNSSVATVSKSIDPSSPTPTYGVFSTSRAVASGDPRSPGGK